MMLYAKEEAVMLLSDRGSSCIVFIIRESKLIGAFHELAEKTAIISLATEGILGHMATKKIHSVEAGLILIADGCDMEKGRARIPLILNTEAKVGDIHKYSSNAIERVTISKGERHPIKVEVEMSSDVGFFQIEEVLLQKISMYADQMSDAMKEAIEETKHRRDIQMAFNKEHNITPKTIIKAVQDIIQRENKEEKESFKENLSIEKAGYNLLEKEGRKKYVKALEKQMLECAKNLQYEQAAAIRDEIENVTKGDLNGTKMDDAYQFPFA